MRNEIFIKKNHDKIMIIIIIRLDNNVHIINHGHGQEIIIIAII